MQELFFYISLLLYYSVKKIFFCHFRGLAAAEAQLGKLTTGLNTVESRVAQLQKELAEHTRSAAELQLRTESAEASLSTARALLQKLDTEHRDWQTQFQELTARKEQLDVEAANAAALLVYQVLPIFIFICFFYS